MDMPSILEDILFEPTLNQNWHMVQGERTALLYTLDRIKSQSSIEIGTFLGGSLRPISHYSQKVYTFDIDQNQHLARELFPNVEFITGDTQQTLAQVISRINASPTEDVNFILIDGSHEENVVRSDITACLQYKPKRRPTVIFMHDSANPAVRRGIETAPWTQCPYIHALDLDFICGMLFDRADIKNQIWGGLAVAIMLPYHREAELQVSRSFEYTRQAMIAQSIYR
jgi:hypothetical protein